MTVAIQLLDQPWAYRVGWTLLHFLWQGAAVAAVLWVTLHLLRRHSPAARYATACAALLLLLLAAAPVVTFIAIPAPAPTRTPLAVSPSGQPDANSMPAVERVSPRWQPDTPPTASQPDLATAGQRGEEWLAQNGWPGPYIERVGAQPDGPYAERIIPSAPGKPDSAGVAAQPQPQRHWLAAITDRLQPLLPHVVVLWLLGVLACSVWHTLGWLRLQRLRRAATPLADGGPSGIWQAAASRLAGLFRFRRPVRLLQTAQQVGPIVLGVFRPAVLIPVSLLTALSPAQVEAILAHELAHIRRHDYLANLLQTVIETLLFYHPAVWWVSARIRAERENCCDDLAIAALSGELSDATGGSPVRAAPGICDSGLGQAPNGRFGEQVRLAYATALADLAELLIAHSGRPSRSEARPRRGLLARLAMGISSRATGKTAADHLPPGAKMNLLARIRRILSPTTVEGPRRATWLAGALILAGLLIAIPLACRPGTSANVSPPQEQFLLTLPMAPPHLVPEEVVCQLVTDLTLPDELTAHLQPMEAKDAGQFFLKHIEIPRLAEPDPAKAAELLLPQLLPERVRSQMMKMPDDQFRWSYSAPEKSNRYQTVVEGLGLPVSYVQVDVWRPGTPGSPVTAQIAGCLYSIVRRGTGVRLLDARTALEMALVAGSIRLTDEKIERVTLRYEPITRPPVYAGPLEEITARPMWVFEGKHRIIGDIASGPHIIIDAVTGQPFHFKVSDAAHLVNDPLAAVRRLLPPDYRIVRGERGVRLYTQSRTLNGTTVLYRIEPSGWTFEIEPSTPRAETAITRMWIVTPPGVPGEVKPPGEPGERPRYVRALSDARIYATGDPKLIALMLKAVVAAAPDDAAPAGGESPQPGAAVPHAPTTQGEAEAPAAHVWEDYRRALDLLFRGGERVEVAARFEALATRWTSEDDRQTVAEARSVAARLRAMADEDRQFAPPAEPDKLNGQARIDYLIHRLRDVAVRGAFNPGATHVLSIVVMPPDKMSVDDARMAAVQLRRLGKEAVPALLGLLDDRRLTRSSPGLFNGSHIMEYRDVAVQILEAIAGRTFLPINATGEYLATTGQPKREKAIADANAWWTANKGREEHEWLPGSVSYCHMSLRRLITSRWSAAITT